MGTRSHVMDGTRLAVAAMALIAMAGCARISTQHVENSSDRLPRPELILVHDYQVSRDDVELDSAISSRLKRVMKGGPEGEDQLEVEQAVSRALTATLVNEIRKLGIRAEPATMRSPVAGPTLSIEGQIVSIHEGNKAKRLVIGLGSGASEVRTLTQVYEMTSEDGHSADRGLLHDGQELAEARIRADGRVWRGGGAGGVARGVGRRGRTGHRALADRRGRRPARRQTDREGAREALRPAGLDRSGAGRQALLGPLRLVLDVAVTEATRSHGGEDGVSAPSEYL
jgi:hypothetical protein